MKRILYTLGLLLPMLWQCSDFIDVRPENSTTYTNYFNSEKDAEALLTQLQISTNTVFLQAWNAGIGDQVDEFYYNWGIHNMLDDYSCYYSWQSFADLVYQANLIIDNAHRFKIGKEKLEPYLLQAYFARGMAYFRMAQVWGEAPIFPNSVTFDKVPKASISDLLDEAERNALKAMDLPNYEDLVAQSSYKRMKQYGSKGAVVALLAHLNAWRAGVEGQDECWKKAEDYCTMLIDGKVGAYSLANNPEEVCSKVMVGDSQESIWEIYSNASEEESYAWISWEVGFPIITTGYYYPGNYSTPCLSREVVREMFPKGDLRRDAYYFATDADYIYLNQTVEGVVPSTEPKGTPTMVYDLDQIVKDNADWTGGFSESYFIKFRKPYYLFNKWIQQPEYKGLSQNKVIYRLADIYLLRAECRARQGKANAADDLNTIRDRAYGNLVNGTVVDFSKAQEYRFPSAKDARDGIAGNIQLAIFREREKELIYEGTRYYDIVRNGMCFIHGKDSYDYIRKEISPAYAKLTNRDIEDGAMYSRIDKMCFKNNDLIRQNRFWNRKVQ